MWWLTKDVSDIKQTVARIETLQAEMKEDLKEHIKRTAQNEGRIESLEENAHQIHGAVKLIAYLAAAVGVIGTLVTIYISFFPRA